MTLEINENKVQNEVQIAHKKIRRTKTEKGKAQNNNNKSSLCPLLQWRQRLD